MGKSNNMSDELEMDLMNFCTVLEAACVDLKQQIAQRNGVTEETENKETRPNEEAINKLFWETQHGSRGDYQQTSKTANHNHATFQALQTYLKKHNGFVMLGSFKYWLFSSNQDIIGRKPK